jgi:Major Facilitator Superfamily
LVFFFVPETAYIRAPIENRLAGVNVQVSDNDNPAAEDEKEAGNTSRLSPINSALNEQSDSYLKSLRFMTGKQYTTAPFWKILIRPIVIFWYPGVLWGFLIYGVTLTWIVVFSVVNAQIFGVPPYSFSPSQVGLVSLSPLIMTIVGLLIAGPLNDFICLYLAKKNRGIYEPEFRLVLMFPVLILGIVGFFGFGATLHYKTHWIGPVLCFGIANMAMTFETGCVFGYIIDSYEDLSEEGLTLRSPFNFLC